jgi:hypothetical protein
MAIADLIKIPTVQAFLMDGSVMTVFEAILEKFALPKERAIELLDLTDAVLDGTLELKDVPAMLVQAFGVEEERATRMACDVVGYRLLPLEQYVPNVVAQLGEWGADMNKYPKSRVGKMKMVPETFAAQLDEKLALDFSEVLIKRAGFLIGAYWTGEKTKESTLTFFSRASTIGGLGLTPEQAQTLIAEIDGSRDLVELLPGTPGERPPAIENSGEAAVQEIEKEFAIEAEKEAVIPAQARIQDIEISPSHEITSELPIVNAPKMHIEAVGNRQKEFKKEVAIDGAEIQEAARTARQVAMTGGADDVIAGATAKALADAKEILAKTGVPETTFADVVTKALKGVRDLYQTRDVLARDLKFAGADLESLTEILEAAHRAVHVQNLVPTASRLAPPTPETPPPTPAPSVLDKRFAAIAKDAPKTHEEEVMPGARVSLARTVEEEQLNQAAAIPQEKLVEAAVASRPAPVTPMLTVGSVAPKQRDGVVTDVQPVRRLMGPVDELGSMTPAEFRRLSTVPADAVQKIEDILSTLEQHAYEERVRGIAAWRKSPMNQLYIAMTTAALTQGIAVAEVAAKRRAAGEESLSPAEIRAVSGLNEKLRF